MSKTLCNFRIADHVIRLAFEDEINDMRLLPSFEPFHVTTTEEEELLFELSINDSTHPIPKSQRERIRCFDTGNGQTIVDRLHSGGYQYIIKNIDGHDCCLLISDKDFRHCRCALNGNYNMRNFGLNNALMLIFAFAGARRQTLLTHASLVRQNGTGYAFIAKSGTGKSTQVSMWLRYLPNCDLMNDDNPIIRIMSNGKVMIYGSPWSGKTPCYRNTCAPLGAITRIERAQKNAIRQLPPIEAFASLLTSVSSMKWDKDIYQAVCNTVSKIVETTAIYTLHCLPDKEAAIICNKTIKIS